MAAMRVAIAGSNTLAVLFAFYIQQNTNYQFVILSRFDRPGITARGFPVLTVDYDDPTTLQHALLGVDTVISTVTGNPQIALIHAAAAQRVSRFAPAEFGSMPNTSGDVELDPLDRGRALANQLLEHYRTSRGMQYCVFVCGILYERFGPGGLQQQWLGLNQGGTGEGEYIVNVRELSAEAPMWDSNGELVRLCMTAAQDVAQFVVEALSMGEWPLMMSMYGERMTVQDLVNLIAEVRDGEVAALISHNLLTLKSEYALAASLGDYGRQARAVNHIATALGRFDYSSHTLNSRFRHIRRTRLKAWLISAWAGSFS